MRWPRSRDLWRRADDEVAPIADAQEVPGLDVAELAAKGLAVDLGDALLDEPAGLRRRDAGESRDQEGPVDGLTSLSAQLGRELAGQHRLRDRDRLPGDFYSLGHAR